MKRMFKRAMPALGATALLIAAFGFLGSTTCGQSIVGVPVTIEIPVAPTFAYGEGKSHLVYELHITNFGQKELSLKRIEVLGNDDRVLARVEESELSNRIMQPGQATNSPDKQRIGGGLRSVVFMWVTMEKGATPVTALRHRLTFGATEASGGAETTAESGRVNINQSAPLVIGPPLRGGEWLAANGPGNASGHRRAMIPLGGKTNIAQRFAIDWVQLREDGRTWKDDQLKNSNYRAYGAEALAVADSTVVAVKDGIPENIPGAQSRAVPITLETVGGNHVILDLGGGRFAFYAHLQPGSIKVKAGDRVRRGQTLGLVGNSGNSTEPHLHFHVSDANSPLMSEGLPYAIESFEVEGKGWGWKASAENPQAIRHEREIPLMNDVIRFLDAAAVQADKKPSADSANPADVATMDAVIAAVYDVISGPAGKKRDWDRMRSLFIPGARMIPVAHTQSGEYIPRVITVEDYITRSGPLLEGEGFVERELARRVEQYGHIAHVFSTYEGRIGGYPQSQRFKDKPEVIRGINSIQLMYDGKRWWVVTIFWDQESKENPLPKKYLKNGQ